MRKIDAAVRAAVRNQDRLCPRSQAAIANHVDTHDTVLFATGCRRWDCKACGPVKKRLLIQRIVKAQPSTMITLTCRRDTTPACALAKITKSLRRLTTKLRAEHGRIEYFRMTEQCIDGYPHFHLLARMPFVEQATLSREWETLTGAPIVDIRKAHGRSYRYVAKYIAKARTQSQQWSRQRCSVTRKFWRDDDERYTEWLGWESETHGIIHTATELSRYHGFEKLHKATWKLVPRQDGDGIPLEIEKVFEEWDEEKGEE